MPERGPLIVAAAGVVAVALIDPSSIPALLLGYVLGIFIGATLPPEWVETPVEGPVTALRRRQPWTEPGFVRNRAYLRGAGR